MTEIKLPIGNETATKGDLAVDVKELEIDGVKHQITNDGTIVDDKGVVLKTKEEVAELLKGVNQNNNQNQNQNNNNQNQNQNQNQNVETTLAEGDEIEIEGNTLTIDKDGNAIDKDKKIVKTKAEVDALIAEQASTEVDYISEIQKVTNYVIEKDGKPVTYENSVEGLASYVKDVAQQNIAIGEKKATEALFKKFPVLNQVLDHLVLNNGSLDNFSDSVDYTTIKLGEDEKQWESIYVASQIARGIPKEDAEKMFKYLKDDKQGKEAAEKGLTYLSTTQKQRSDEAKRIFEQQMQDEKEKEVAYYNEVSSIIKSRSLKVDNKTYTLPEVIRIKDENGRQITKSLDDFVNYLSSPINVNIEGKIITTTKWLFDQYNAELKRTTNDDVLEAFRLFTGFDTSQLVEAGIKNQNVRRLVIRPNASSSSSSTSKSTTGSKIVLPIQPK